MKTILILSLLILTLFSSCSSEETKQDEEATNEISIIEISEDDRKKNGIETGMIPLVPVYASIKANGKVEVPAVSRANVYAVMNGRIKQLYVLPGQKVKKGERLATITDMGIVQLQEDYLKSKANIEYLLPEMNRKKELAAGDAVSKKELEKIISEYKMEEASLNGLKNKLRIIGISAEYIEKNGIQTEIAVSSPIAGFVSDVHVALGEAVHDSKLLFEVIDNSYMHIVVRVPVSEIDRIEVGQDCSYGLNTGKESLKGKVHLIGKKADESTATVEVHIDPEKGTNALVAGSNVYAHIYTGTDTVHAVFTSELIRKGESFFIYAAKDKGWEAVEVEVGISDENYTEILNENLRNRNVVLKGNYFVASE